MVNKPLGIVSQMASSIVDWVLDHPDVQVPMRAYNLWATDAQNKYPLQDPDVAMMALQHFEIDILQTPRHELKLCQDIERKYC